MPNYCDIDAMVQGPKKSVRRFLEYINADYHYGDTDYKISTEMPTGEEIPCKHHIGYRVFEFNDNFEDFADADEDEVISIYGWGYVAWSAGSTLFTGPYSYYMQEHKEHLIKYGKDPALTLPQAARILGLEIELFSSECGECFSEHYRINSEGKILLRQVTGYYEIFLDDTGTYEEYKAQFDEGVEPPVNEKQFNKALEQGDSCLRICKWLDEDGNWVFTET